MPHRVQLNLRKQTFDVKFFLSLNLLFFGSESDTSLKKGLSIYLLIIQLI